MNNRKSLLGLSITTTTTTIDCKAVPFFLPTSERRAGGDWCEMRGRAGLDDRGYSDVE